MFRVFLCLLGLVACVTQGAPNCGKFLENKDIQGNDLANVRPRKMPECCGECARRTGCKAFSWTWQDGGTCWLKSAARPLIHKQNVHSQIMGDGGGDNGNNGKYNYGDALAKSILFFNAQRSGRLPQDIKNRLPWRGDSALNDGKDVGHDLTGGWYDAGDGVKFNFPMASSATLLAWGAIDFADGYSKAGQMDRIKDSVRWVADYLMRCVKNEHGQTVIYGQLGNGHEDHKHWIRPEDMGNMWRPAYKLTAGKPGSDLAGETAAALAAASILLKSSDAGYANQLLAAAKTAYAFGERHKGKYSDSISDAISFYGSTGYNDELSWGAAWLYRATNDQRYLNKAKQYYSSQVPWSLSWDSKYPGVQMLMFQLTKDGQYGNHVKQFISSWKGMRKTPKGLNWRDKWGALRYAGNTALIVLMAAKEGIDKQDNLNYARGQMNYILGDTGRSFVVGFGNNPPQRPHHRAASCPGAGCSWNDYNSPNPNPHVLYGALVGGPDEHGNYEDRRNDYIKNEVACDYNAGFQGALAGLIQLS